MSVRIGEGAVVCDGAVLQGDISIGANTIIFPGARIQCHENSGTIVIGRGCVIEEGASLVQAAEGEMRLGVGNLLEVGCTVSAPEVGDYNVFQPKCEVGKEVTVASGCNIGATVRLDVVAALEDNVSVFRCGGQPDEYRMRVRPRNTENNRAKVQCYATAVATQGKKYYLGKYNKILPPSPPSA